MKQPATILVLRHKYIHKLQSGFLPGYSTSHQLVEIYHCIMTAFENQTPLSLTFCDTWRLSLILKVSNVLVFLSGVVVDCSNDLWQTGWTNIGITISDILGQCNHCCFECFPPPQFSERYWNFVIWTLKKTRLKIVCYQMQYRHSIRTVGDSLKEHNSPLFFTYLLSFNFSIS
jgi:hypothetical protein